MSGIVKSVKKVFKSVTKSPIGKIALAAGIAYFTAGMGSYLLGSLGVGTTAASGAFTIAGSETLGTVLSNALSGTVAGGLTAGVTGDNIGKGLGFGALGGAVMGGARAALGDFTMGSGVIKGGEGDAILEGGSPGDDMLASDAASGVQQVGTSADPNAIYNANAPATVADPGIGSDPAAFGAQRAVPADFGGGGGSPFSGVPSLDGGATAAAPESGKGLLSSLGGWIERNPTAAVAGGGALVSGLGQGLLAKATADASEKSSAEKLKAEQERLANVAASHAGGTGGLMTQGLPTGQPARPTPAEKFDPRTYQGMYVYDPAVGRIVFVPNAQRQG